MQFCSCTFHNRGPKIQNLRFCTLIQQAADPCFPFSSVRFVPSLYQMAVQLTRQLINYPVYCHRQNSAKFDDQLAE